MTRTYVARFVETYFRHRRLNLVPILLMLGLGIIWVALSKPQYTAQGTMYIQRSTLLATLVANAQNQSGWASPADATSSEIKSLLQTDAFVRAVIKGSDLEPQMNNGPRAVDQTMNKVRSAVTVQSMGQNMVLISAVHTSPVIAQQLSAGVMQNYTQWRINTDRSDGAAAQAYFENLIPSYQAALDTARQNLQTYLAQHPDPVRGGRPTEETVEIGWLQTTVQDATTRLNDAVTKFQAAQSASGRADLNGQGTYSIIDAPHIPTDSATSRRQQLLRVLIFAAAGLLLSLACVVGAALFDASLRFPGEVRQVLDLPVLGAIPEIEGDADVKHQESPQALQPVAAPQGA